MLTRPRCALFAILILAACADSFDPVEPPSDIRYVAVIQSNEDGSLRSASPLFRYEGRPLMFDVDPEAARIWAAGYNEDEVIGEPSGDPLVEAKGCDPALPAARWSSPIKGEPGRLELRLTAPWMNTCVRLTSVEVDVTCAVSGCAVTPFQDGCSLNLDLSGCDLDTLTARVQPAGELCVEVEPDPGVCKVEVYADPPRFPGDERAIIVEERARARAPALFSVNGLNPSLVHSGWFSDFDVLSDRWVVATHDGRYQDSRVCEDTRPMRARIFALEFAGELAAPELPPCTSQLFVDRSRPGFFGFFGGTTWSIGQFDELGVLTASAAVPLPATKKWEAVAAVVPEGSGEVWAIFPSYDVPHSYAVVTADLSTLSARVVEIVEDESSIEVIETDAGVIAISEIVSGFVRYFDTVTETTIGRARPTSLNSYRLGKLAWLPGPRKTAAPVVRDDPSLYLFDGPGAIDDGRGFFASPAASPFAAIAWPSDQVSVLVAAVSGITEDTLRTELALYDVATDRFRPGALEAGYGLPTQIIERDGVVWIGLAWEGKVVRIVAR